MGGMMVEFGECAFEPDMTEIRCVECNRTTGRMGTCRDVDFCAACREEFITSGVSVGFTRKEAEVSFSEMLIAMIEGRGYNSKFKPQRVMHLSRHGSPYCGIKGGPHPLTEDVNQSNCKRCLKVVASEGSKPKR
jgi:hypothetical protein